MPYDPHKHHRRSIRLKGFDYSSPGSYFVTICTYRSQPILGQLVDQRVILSDVGVVVEQGWQALPGHFSEITLDAWVIMPNHVHGIITIHLRNPPQKATQLNRPGGTQAQSLSAIIQNFKAITTRRANQRAGVTRRIWHRNFYERVLRNEAEIAMIRRYIEQNPIQASYRRQDPDRT